MIEMATTNRCLLLLELLLLGAGCGGGARVPVDADAGAGADAGVDAAPFCVQGAVAFTEHAVQPVWPPGLWHAAMAPDLDRGEVLLFGGALADPGGRSNQAWSWNSATGTWTNLTPDPVPSSWPVGLSDHGMTWDPVRHTILMFGGERDDFSNSDELWEWNGGARTWTNLTPAQRPAAWPEGRYSHGMTYDVARKRLVVMDGFGPLSWPGYAGDVWDWSSADGTWTDRTPDPLPANWPEPRQSMAVAFDPVRQRVLMFGGWSNIQRDDAWEWDGVSGTWTDRTPAVRPTAWPSAGLWTAMVFDPVRRMLVMLGGEVTLTMTTEIWDWDGASGAWTDPAPVPVPAVWPPARMTPVAAWDAATSGILFFGGQTAPAAVPLADTWTWGCGG